jgi:hypothetical protein
MADKFWLKDPDGHAWEFWVHIAEADRMQGEEAVAVCQSLKFRNFLRLLAVHDRAELRFWIESNVYTSLITQELSLQKE